MDLQIIQNFVNDYPLIAAALIAWSLVWKGLALWQAGGRRERNWFIALLILNTLGILEIIYLFFVIPHRAAQLSAAGSSESEKIS
ncbi:MAG TPA: DUF5652 family protein [Candidatus Paceibacterota bacterium]